MQSATNLGLEAVRRLKGHGAARIKPRSLYQRRDKKAVNWLNGAAGEFLFCISVRKISFLIPTNGGAETIYWAVQSPRGDPWPETFNYSAAIAGRTLPSQLLIRRSFRNAATRPQSVARIAVWQRKTTRGAPATVRLQHRVHL